MNFRTAIDFPGNPGYIDHRQQILLLGSCFAENIGLLKTNFSLSIIYGTVTITIPDSRGATKRPRYRS